MNLFPFRPGLSNLAEAAKEYGVYKKEELAEVLKMAIGGFVDLFKTTSNFYVADGLIFKGLMGYSPIATNHSDIIQWRKPLKISPLLE